MQNEKRRIQDFIPNSEIGIPNLHCPIGPPPLRKQNQPTGWNSFPADPFARKSLASGPQAGFFTEN
jgi:hypothetical protein